jgi:hypothetical protein
MLSLAPVLASPSQLPDLIAHEFLILMRKVYARFGPFENKGFFSEALLAYEN